MRRWTVCPFGCLAALVFGCLALIGSQVNAAEDASPAKAASAPVFETDVLPLLQAHCLKCHGEKVRKLGIDLRSVASMLKGGEAGEPVILPGKADESRLVEMISLELMPPDDEPKLTPEQIDLIRAWIDGGAPSRAGKPADVPESLSPELQTARKAFDILELKCYVCHGRKKHELLAEPGSIQPKGFRRIDEGVPPDADLDLRTVEAMLKGGKSGPAIVPGDAENSLLVQRVAKGLEPPRLGMYELSIRPVTPPELETLKRWIDEGAQTPPPRPIIQNDGQLVTDADRQWWAFQPPKRPDIPKVENRQLVRTPIDAFLLARLEAKGLSFSREADRRTLMRRAYLDVTGLPPTPAEADAFLNDTRSDAYEELVDRLLASPRYGERWGQHWLDAAGYSDSEGSDGGDVVRPEFFRYRDYVIRSLNADKPYDRFVQEQLAGDELEDYLSPPTLTPGLADNLIATGFLRTPVDSTDRPVHNFYEDRFAVLTRTMQMVGSSLMGLTMECAQCHSHKYDPLPQRDYYRMASIFAAAYTPLDWRRVMDRYVELGTRAEREAVEKHNAALDEKKAPLQAEIDELTETFKEKGFEHKLSQLPDTLRDDARRAIELAPDDRDEIQKYLVDKLEDFLAVSPAELPALFPEFKEKAAPLEEKIAALERERKSLPRIRGLTDTTADALPFYLCVRGDIENRGDVVLPNVPAVLREKGDEFQVERPWPGAPSTGRRLAFARWLTRPENPLTARVFVNRVWQHHFGTGIVSTPDNFGHTGAAPSHPELLDWLATEFVRQGWSMKALHRLILISTAYRQDSQVRSDALAVDPENKLIWRMPMRRLDAEVIRDSIFYAAGSLNLNMHGSAAEVVDHDDSQATTKDDPEHVRRSIYMLHRRLKPLTMLDTFDAPRINVNCVVRRTSTVASQALLLLNSETLATQSAKLADRVQNEAGPDVDAQIALAYRLVLCRSPHADEPQLVRDFLIHQATAHAEDPAGKEEVEAQSNTNPAAVARERALADLCLVLFNSPEFVYVD